MMQIEVVKRLRMIGDTMDVQYLEVTPELKELYSVQSGTNACDFIQFDTNYYSVMALAEGRPIALITAKSRCLPEPLQTVKEAFIDIIEVLPDYQRKGIGTALVEKVIQWAQANQVTQIRAWSEEIRREALLLWNKMGFTFTRIDFQRGEEQRYGFYVAKRI
jgi:GNAT superfamily N-acetyltransferase